MYFRDTTLLSRLSRALAGPLRVLVWILRRILRWTRRR